MNLAVIGFRFRVVIFVLLYLIGFFPPWEWGGGRRDSFWLSASTWVARSGWLGLEAATLTVTLAALGCLLLGTILRVWGSAYLGAGVMSDASLQGQTLIAAGPYRYLRNPLYLGAWLLSLGLSILMPLSGAAVFLPAFSLFLMVLISAEERFLEGKQGEAYEQYRRTVPRLWPRLRGRSASLPARPHWLQAAFAETYPIAITICFAIFAWRYNARVLLRCVLICYGLSLVVRALMKPGADLASRVPGQR
jgi:protein-S-isoprenylcysteine O-methyltransferase Ste14